MIDRYADMAHEVHATLTFQNMSKIVRVEGKALGAPPCLCSSRRAYPRLYGGDRRTAYPLGAVCRKESLSAGACFVELADRQAERGVAAHGSHRRAPTGALTLPS